MERRLRAPREPALLRAWKLTRSAARPKPERLLFLLMAAWGGAMMALCPHLPMVDLPQHAAQAALLRALLGGGSPWGHLVQLNRFTPYALEYLLTLALPFVPVQIAFTLLLEAAYVGFLLALLAFRRALKGDPRLDLLFIPGFFGFAWEFGFVPFLLAAPFAILFMLAARTHARAPGWRQGLLLSGAGILVFFGHGLTFLFALLAGGLFTLAAAHEQRRLRWRLVLPYLPLVALALAYHFLSPRSVMPDQGMAFRESLDPWGRLNQFFVLPLGLASDAKLFGFLTVGLLSSPWLLGCRLNRSAAGWWVPFGAAVLVFCFAPDDAFNAGYIYQRFALFLLAGYALLFRPGPAPPGGGRLKTVLGLAVLTVGNGAYLGVRTDRLLRFSRESAGIDTVLMGLPPGRRVLDLTSDPGSRAARQPDVYQHYGAWYQACRGGFVDVNFAIHPEPVVRFRPGCAPVLPRGLDGKPSRFQFQPCQAWIYDFIILKGRSAEAGVLAERITGDPACPFDLYAAVDDWRVYQRRARPGPAAPHP